MRLLFEDDKINVKIVVKYKDEETPDVIDIVEGNVFVFPWLKVDFLK